MQTNFSLAALADPNTDRSNKILRACVHCGFCNATCPTFLITGDELDSPRGRIYLIKEMLENERSADTRVVRHIDRCLSCLSCMTTCPSSVHYQHLVDDARARIERTYDRPLGDSLLRSMLAYILARPIIFRLALRVALFAKPIEGHLPKRLRELVAMAPKNIPTPSAVDRPQVFPALGPRKMRVALLNGCAQTVLNTRINESTVRLLTRLGVEVVVARDAGCCGALAHHLGKVDEGRDQAGRNIEAWSREMTTRGLDHVVINTSGCGVHVKDYGFLFQRDEKLARKAAHIASIACDVSEIVAKLDFAPSKAAPRLRVAYHAACSLQHGQKITQEPIALLRAAGFEVLEIPEGHICCGSAGVYNVLQSDLADELRARKAANIESLKPDVVAAGNLGCMMQIARSTAVPVAHLVELLDWASESGSSDAKPSATNEWLVRLFGNWRAPQRHRS